MLHRNSAGEESIIIHIISSRSHLDFKKTEESAVPLRPRNLFKSSITTLNLNSEELIFCFDFVINCSTSLLYVWIWTDSRSDLISSSRCRSSYHRSSHCCCSSLMLASDWSVVGHVTQNWAVIGQLWPGTRQLSDQTNNHRIPQQYSCIQRV